MSAGVMYCVREGQAGRVSGGRRGAGAEARRLRPSTSTLRTHRELRVHLSSRQRRYITGCCCCCLRRPPTGAAEQRGAAGEEGRPSTARGGQLITLPLLLLLRPHAADAGHCCSERGAGGRCGALAGGSNSFCGSSDAHCAFRAAGYGHRSDSNTRKQARLADVQPVGGTVAARMLRLLSPQRPAGSLDHQQPISGESLGGAVYRSDRVRHA